MEEASMEKLTLILGKPMIMEGRDLPTQAIGEIQRRVNELMGMSDQDFLKHNGSPEREITKNDFNTIGEIQRRVNELMGVSDQDFLKHNGSPGRKNT
jgi:hypothetical protein